VQTYNAYRGGANGVYCRSFDFGRTWDRVDFGNVYQPSGFAGDSMTMNYVWLSPDRTQIKYEINTLRGGNYGWRPLQELQVDTNQHWMPGLATAMTQPDSIATAWVLYSHAHQGGSDWDVDFAVRSHTWGDTWIKGQYLASTPAREMLGDTRSTRKPGETWIAACLLTSDTLAQDSQVVYCTWITDQNPLYWEPFVKASDTILTSDSVTPRIIYSPGAEDDLGGVLFSHQGSYGVYFNAAWLGTGAVEDSNGRVAPALLVRPNPARGRVQFSVPVSSSGAGRASIYDASGRMVRTFDITKSRGPAARFVTWDGRDERGNAVTAGAYFIRLSTARGNLQTKVLFLP
jgi:hypothetical protein